MSRIPNRRQMRFEGDNLGGLLHFLDTKYGHKGFLTIDVDDKKVVIFTYEKFYWRTASDTSCTIVFYKSEPNACDIYLWGSGGRQGVLGSSLGSERSIRDKVAKEIAKYAIENLGLRKTYDEKEDIPFSRWV